MVAKCWASVPEETYFAADTVVLDMDDGEKFPARQLPLVGTKENMVLKWIGLLVVGYMSTNNCFFGPPMMEHPTIASFKLWRTVLSNLAD